MFGPTIRTIIFAVCLICCSMSSSAVAGEPEFKISSYIPERFVDFEWRLDGHIDFNGDYDRSQSYYSDDDTTLINSKVSDNHNLSGTSFISYRLETIPWFLRLDLFSKARIQYSKTQTSSDVHHDRTGVDLYDLIVNTTIDYGKYITPDLSLSIIGKLGWSYEGNITTNDYKIDEKNYSVEMNILPGWGRIYEGQYAATAIYIIDELLQNNLILRTPKKNEMISLTDTIYVYRLSHAIDHRLHKIKALSSIMDYLANEGIIDNLGQYAYLLIQDVWDYFPRYERPFGFIFRAGPGLKYNYNSRQLNHVDDADYWNDYIYRKGKALGTNIRLLTEYTKPVSLRWQIMLLADWKYYLNQYSFDLQDAMNSFQYEHQRDYNVSYEIELLAETQYIFDSRTSAVMTAAYARLLIHEIWQRTLRKNGIFRNHSIIRKNLHEEDITLTLQMNYRISIPTTLRVGLRYFRNNSHRLTDSEFSSDIRQRSGRYSFSIDLSHYLY